MGCATTLKSMMLHSPETQGTRSVPGTGKLLEVRIFCVITERLDFKTSRKVGDVTPFSTFLFDSPEIDDAPSSCVRSGLDPRLGIKDS